MTRELPWLLRILEIQMLFRLTLAGLLLALTASGAVALAAMIGDTFVKLPPPDGFCELTPRYEFDGRAVAVISSLMASENIKLLAMSADCDQLAAAREGARQLDDVAAYLISNADVKMPTPFSVANKCKTFGASDNNTIETDVDARVASMLPKIDVNKGGAIGVIAEDDSACYTATITRHRADNGTDKVFVNLQADTVVRTKAIMIRRQAVYLDRGAIKALLPKFKSEVAAFIAANP